MQNITIERYRNIQRMQKVQRFQYENESLKYDIENSVNLNDLIKQEQNKIKCFTIGELFIITNKIVDQLLKVYQISKLAKLEMDSIYVNIENNEITFTNVHINKDLVSYEDNLNQIIEISYQIFLKHQEFLKSLINENNTVDLSKRIQYITEFSNQVLGILKTANYHMELNQFVQKNIKDKQLIHDNFKDVIEIDQYIAQPQAFKKVEIPYPQFQRNPQIQQEVPLVDNKKKKEGPREQFQQQQNEYQYQYQQQQQQEKEQLQPQQFQDVQEYEYKQQLYALSQYITTQESIDQQGDEGFQQSLGQSTISPQLYTFIEGQLKSLNLGGELYEYMLKFFIQNFKNSSQNQIIAKIDQLARCYNYPKHQNEQFPQELLLQWQNTITDEFITSKSIDLNQDIEVFLQKLSTLFTKIFESQQY
ncbi:unnamed protein product [Paramecium octaurelia]|uniref:Uncharacterized protein n=1 Tax=Paramecium octaurelia TaxID=43137 RepID=A0A8S1RTM6_PAROT|nr:unnamed protein product [Paramecium octaurelia]